MECDEIKRFRRRGFLRPLSYGKFAVFLTISIVRQVDLSRNVSPNRLLGAIRRASQFPLCFPRHSGFAGSKVLALLFRVLVFSCFFGRVGCKAPSQFSEIVGRPLCTARHANGLRKWQLTSTFLCQSDGSGTTADLGSLISDERRRTNALFVFLGENQTMHVFSMFGTCQCWAP